jgi:hypothetical protein
MATTEEKLEMLTAAVATLQGQVANLVNKLTVRQAALLTDSQIQDLDAKYTTLEARITVLEGKIT